MEEQQQQPTTAKKDPVFQKSEKQQKDNPYCTKACINIDQLKKGNMSNNSVIPPNILVNGVIIEILKLKPSWVNLTSWLTIWMGDRFPPGTTSTRLNYVVSKITEKRKKLLRTKTTRNKELVRLLEEESFIIPLPGRPPTSFTPQPPQPSDTLGSSASPAMHISDPSCDFTVLPSSSQTSPAFTGPGLYTRSILPTSSQTSPAFTRPGLYTRSILPTSSQTSPAFTGPGLYTRSILPTSSQTSPAFTRPGLYTRSILPTSSQTSPAFTRPGLYTRSILPTSSQTSPAFTGPGLYTRSILPTSSQTSPAFTRPGLYTRSILPTSSQTTPVARIATVSSTVCAVPSPPTCASLLLPLQAKLKNTQTRERRKAMKLKKQEQTIAKHERLIRSMQKQKARLLSKLKRSLQKKKVQKPPKSTKSTQAYSSCSSCDKHEVDFMEAQDRGRHTGEMEVPDFISGRGYSDNFKQCVLTLLDHNIANHRVSPVIAAVLKLVNLTPSRLPSRETVEEIGKMRLPLSHLNIISSLKGQPHTTLYSDETNKFGHQYETYAITTEEQERKILAIRETKDKSAATNLDTFKEILADFDRIDHTEETPVGKTILTNIKNTMSDRAASEKAFHKLLSEYRTTILPEVIENWTLLTQGMRDAIGKMHNFYCGLHLLVSCAEKSEDTLVQYEQKEHNDTDGKVTKSSIVNAVQVCCKAFSRGGDEKSGCYSKISVFLAARGVTSFLTPFKGNRFNILFHNAGILYHQSSHLTDFLQNYWGTPNQLLSTALVSLKSPLCIAGCRALGLLSKFLTKPLWNILEKEGNILAMNTVYQTIISSLQNVPARLLLTGTATIVPGIEADDHTDVFKSLTTSSDNDILTETMLEALMQDIASHLSHLLKDQLPGGDNATLTEEGNPECRSTVKHNKLPESVFGRLDYNQRRKPSASTYTNESAILYHFNKVGAWLDGLTQHEKHQVMGRASCLRHQSYAVFLRRKQQIKEDRYRALLAKREDMKRKKNRLLQQKITRTSDIVTHGLWQSVEEVDSRLLTYNSNTAKVKALKVQLNFRKQVLAQQVSPKSLYVFSLNKRPLSVQQLTNNLKSIIRQAGENLLTAPQISPLVSKRVRHTFMENDERTAYNGRVISQVPGFPDWYNIVYDEEPRTVYTYQLEEDLTAGDLQILCNYKYILIRTTIQHRLRTLTITILKFTG